MPSGIVRLPLPGIFFSLLAILTSPSGQAQAAALGKMTVLSTLGSRFEAEVPLLDARADKQPGAECFRIAQTGENDIPMLKRGRISVEQQRGGLRLHIVSDQTINEPLLQVNLRVGCGAEVVRNYVLLIDPPAARTAQRAPEPSAVRGGPALGLAARQAPAPDAPPAAILGHRPPASPARAVARAGATPDAQGPSAAQFSGPAGQKLSAAGSMTDRLLLSSGNDGDQARGDSEMPLRLSTRLSTRLFARASEEQRAILRLEYRLLAALHTQAVQQLAIAEQLRRLEATVIELQKKSEAEALPAGQARSATHTAASAAGARPVGSAGEPPARSSAVAGPAAIEPADWWLEAGLLLGLIAGLSWFLLRRSRTQPHQPENTPPADALPSSSKDSGWQLQMVGATDKTIAPESTTTTDTFSLAEDATNEFALSPNRQEDEVTAVLELAEIMVSFGRVKGAEQALQEFIDQSLTAAVAPWLKLLEVHRQNGEREAFTALGLQLTRTFNVAPTAWEDWATSGELAAPKLAGNATTTPIEQLLARLPTLGKLTHIRKELAQTWDSPDCLAYLNKLLRDNRNGERKGFALRAVRELIFLIELQESRLTRARPETADQAE